MIDGLEAITFDFGNTLVPFPANSMATVVRRTAEWTREATGCRVEEFITVWGQERLRQFAEDVPEGREADMDIRAGRVLARLRGRAAPAIGSRWDAAEVGRFAAPEEVQGILNAYASAFVAATPVPPGVREMLARLALHYRLGILSNWPLALAVERFVESAGWAPHLKAVVVSHRVGVIKPWPGIFETAARELEVASGPAILHVGDDVGADVVGAHRLGWRTAWVRCKPEDSPLPVASPVPDAIPDLAMDSVTDLEGALGLQTATGAS